MRITGESARTRRLLAGTALALAAPLALAGCFGGGDDQDPRVTDGPLADAQAKLLDTSGVDVTLTAEQLPRGVDGVRKLTGSLSNAPAFEGKVVARVNDNALTLPMVSVDGAVFAQLPYTDTFVEIDPTAYGSPDPADLMDPDKGLADWLGSTEDAKEDDSTVTGTIPGKVVAATIPSASTSGSFRAEWTLDDDGLLEEGTVTGPFYGSEDLTYVVALENYDSTPDITAPKVK